MQTCRRHPNAGPFVRTCPGCARKLYDIETANRAHAEGRRALTLVGAPTAEILAVEATPTTLIVATRQPTSLAYEYAVDAFRLPTAAESDPDEGDDWRFAPDAWHLDWQAGEHSADMLPQMIADARHHLLATGRITHDTPTTHYPAPAASRHPEPKIRLVELPTAPVLPTTQTEADHARTEATNVFWDHAENCEQCLNAEDATTATHAHCQIGTTLAQQASEMALVATEFTALDAWYRRGGREAHNASDYVAS